MVRFFYLVFLSLVGMSLSAETTIPFFTHQQDMGQEKLYLSLDRPYYEAGDTIWFRGTLVSAENLSYMVKTNYVYVELLNRSDQLVMRRKVLREGLCFAHCLPLAEGLASGEYTLRAYTSWMRNFDPDFFFTRKLTILNAKVSAREDLPQTDLDFGMTFFPEGGGRIKGAEQLIAFKAEGSNGLPVEIDGIVKDAANKKIAEIHSAHDGMGTFILPASVGSAILYAEVRVRDYVDRYGMPFGRTFPLPQISEQRYALSVERISEDSVRWHILGTANESLQNLVLILHSGSKLVSEQEVTAVDGGLSLRDCRDGISHLVLATRDGIGLSRRLLFKYNKENHIEGEIRLTEGNLKEPRELTTWSVALRDSRGLPMRGDFSVSVLDAALVNCNFDSLRDDIVSNLLLTSDLKGYVHDAGWYFGQAPLPPKGGVSEPLITPPLGGQGADIGACIDLLMLTHGWCRFATDTLQIRDREFPHPLEEKEWLSGKVSKLSWRDKDRTIPITVMDTTGKSYGMGQLDSLGNFFIGDLNYPDDARLHVRILSKGKRPKFTFDRPTFPKTGHKEPFRLDFKTYMQDTVNLKQFFIDSKGMRTRTLQNVEVTDHRRDSLGSRVYHDVKDYHYIQDNYDLYVYDRGFDVVNQMIQNEWYKYCDPIEAFPEIEYGWKSYEGETLMKVHSFKPTIYVIDGEGKHLRAGNRKPSSTAGFHNEADGMNNLELVHSTDIDSIVCNITSTIKLGSSSGVGSGRMTHKKQLNYDSYNRRIYVYLKHGVTINELKRDHRHTAHYTFGYTPPVDFYNPLYNTAEAKTWPVLDLRKTLRWIPSLQTDETGEVKFQFYNSDHPGPRVIVIEGVTFSGKPFRIKQCLW